MAYNDKRLKTDLEGKPIPQAYNPDIDDYEPVHSTNNALKQVIYGPNGQPISTVGNKLAVRATELEALMQGLATEGKLEQVRQLLSGVATEAKLEQVKSELELIKSELQTIKANQLSGDQKVTLKDASGAVVSPATEATLEQVRALLSGVATENKLEQARALLEAISTKDFATSSKQDALNIAVEDLKSELNLVKSELEAIKANQLSGDQKVQLSGTPFATLKDANGNVVSPATEDKLEQVRQLLTGVATEAKLEQVKSELELVKSELQTIKTNQTSGDQKVQLSGTFTEDILNKVDLSNRLLALISHGQTKAVLNSWQQVQHIVRAGLHHQVFQIGDQFVATFDGQPVVWDVIGIDHDKPTDPRFTHSLTIQSHDCLLNALFDAPEPNNPDSNRQQFGNNRYIHSAIRQWLNSAETTFTWQPQHQYDVAPTGAPYDGPGFLKLLDPDLVAVLGAVDKQVARSTTDGGGQDLFSDKVFLLSRVEVYGVDEGATTGEEVYPFYKAMASSPTIGEIEERIKYQGASARAWWLRSPHAGNAHFVRYVHTSGSITGNYASSSIGVAPAVVIV